ncbi:hypothetical protein ABZ912_38170 [Nonomuraea angiospora]|uniref:hypothetical protein n=1 Tax=Nonomuraea angiospora TaxID=46172 RepID=UPI0033CDF1E9
MDVVGEAELDPRPFDSSMISRAPGESAAVRSSGIAGAAPFATVTESVGPSRSRRKSISSRDSLCPVPKVG